MSTEIWSLAGQCARGLRAYVDPPRTHTLLKLGSGNFLFEQTRVETDMYQCVHPTMFGRSFSRDLQLRNFCSEIEAQIVANKIGRNVYETQLSGGSYTKLCFEQPRICLNGVDVKSN